MRAVVRLAADTGRETAQAFDPAWLGILRAVVRSGPVRPAELAQALDLKPTAVARNVRSMAEDQFIEITNDDAGADSTLVSATDAGRAELRQINDIGVDFLGAVIEDWSADDICSLTSLITRLIDDWGRFQRSAARGVRGPEGR